MARLEAPGVADASTFATTLAGVAYPPIMTLLVVGIGAVMRGSSLAGAAVALLGIGGYLAVPGAFHPLAAAVPVAALVADRLALGTWRRFACALGAAWIGALWPTGTSAPLGSDPQPQAALPARLTAPASDPAVLLISVDTLRYDSFRSAVAKLPADAPLSLWLARAAVYDDAHAVAPWTLPSMAGVMSGDPPDVHGAGWRQRDTRSVSRIRDEVPLLAESLRDAGFVTAAVVSNPYLSHAFGFARGFDVYREQDALARGAAAIAGRSLLYPIGRAAEAFVPADAPGITDVASEYLQRLVAGRFFLWVHYMDPHEPYRGGASELGAPWTCGTDPAAACFARTREARAGEEAPSDSDRAVVRALYEGDVQRTIRAISDLLGELAEEDPGRRVSVVLLADHGEEFWEHGSMGHGQSLHEELLHVPLAVALPGYAAGPVTGDVGLDQVAPSILAALGVPVGPNRAPVLPVVSSTTGRAVPAGCLLFGEQQRSVLLDGRKLITAPRGDEVYSLTDDPGEHLNRVASDVATDLRANLPATTPQEGTFTETDALRSIGYLQ